MPALNRGIKQGTTVRTLARLTGNLNRRLAGMPVRGNEYRQAQTAHQPTRGRERRRNLRKTYSELPRERQMCIHKQMHGNKLNFG